MLKVILTKGLPASGKTTWAKELIDQNPNTYKRINKDDLRAMLDNGFYSSDAEKFILKVRDALILEALGNGKHVIVDDTNLAPKHKARIEQLVKGKAVVVIQDFTDTPLSVCIERDLKRCNSVGSKVIKDMFKQFLKPLVTSPVYDAGLPTAIICDLDGTLCHLNGRNPYDASTCYNDEINSVVRNIIRAERVIYISGREEKYRAETERWLDLYSLKQTLYMRETGDSRKDAIIKKEIYDNHIKGKYNIKFVLDDRNQVVDMWRNELGLTCLQVAEGDF